MEVESQAENDHVTTKLGHTEHYWMLFVSDHDTKSYYKFDQAKMLVELGQGDWINPIYVMNHVIYPTDLCNDQHE